MQNGEWIEPDRAFAGRIVVDERNNELYGYSREYYIDHMPKSCRLRYLIGTLTPISSNGEQGIAFYKLSNDLNIDPLMFVTPDLVVPESGSWYGLGTFGIYFEKIGKTRIEIEEKAYSKEEEKEIKKIFGRLNRNREANRVMLNQLDWCKEMLTEAG